MPSDHSTRLVNCMPIWSQANIFGLQSHRARSWHAVRFAPGWLETLGNLVRYRIVFAAMAPAPMRPSEFDCCCCVQQARCRSSMSLSLTTSTASNEKHQVCPKSHSPSVEVRLMEPNRRKIAGGGSPVIGMPRVMREFLDMVSCTTILNSFVTTLNERLALAPRSLTLCPT